MNGWLRLAHSLLQDRPSRCAPDRSCRHGRAEQGEQGPMEMWGDASRFRRCDRRMPAYMSFQYSQLCVCLALAVDQH